MADVKKGTPLKVGTNYFVRTITMYYTGRLVEVYGKWLVLEDTAWIASTGRFSNALKTGQLDEVEPYPDGEVVINREAVVDASGWAHPLPRDGV